MHRPRLPLVMLAVLVAAATTAAFVADARPATARAPTGSAIHAYDGSSNNSRARVVDDVGLAASAPSESPRLLVVDGTLIGVGASVVATETAGDVFGGLSRVEADTGAAVAARLDLGGE